MQHLPGSDFDDFVKSPLGGRGHIPADIGFEENALTIENQDLSSFTFGDEEYVSAQAPEVPVESTGKESTGKFTHLLYAINLSFAMRQ